MRTGADRTLELLEAQVGRSLARGRDTGRGRRSRPPRGQPPGSPVLRGRARDRALAAHEDAQVARDRHAPARARRRRPDRREDRRGAGLPRGRRLPPARPLPAHRRRQVGAAGAARGRGRRSDGRGRRPVRRRGALRGARAARGAARRCSSRWTSGCTAPARRPRTARSPSPSSSPACLPSRSPASAATPATAGATTATIRARVAAVDALLRETRDAFLAAGLRCDRISGGSTPTRYLTHETCVNELRSGTYALLDRTDGPPERCALHVEVTVISDAVPGQIVIDAGSKTLTSDTAPEPGNGAIVGYPDADLHDDQRGARLRRRLRGGRAPADRRSPAA